MRINGIAWVLLSLAMLLAGCNSTDQVEPVASEPPTASATQIPTHTATTTPSPTPTDTPSPTATFTPTPTPIPTYTNLRGQVIPEKLSCRFGPGYPYLYKYGILATTNIDLIGRMEHGDWVLVQAIGGNNPCWVRADYLEIQGDVLALEPKDAHIVLAWSPYYGSLTGAAAVREGDQVTLSWHPLVLRAGDDSGQTPYVVEAWLCQDGEVRFEAIGAYYPELTVTDQAGCSEASHARVAGAEKHGYTPWSEFPWPDP